MRRVRWKSKFATGNRPLDEHHKALVSILQEIDAALRAREHCQDMVDLYAMLTDLSAERLAKGESFEHGPGSDTAFQGLLDDSLPLDALNTPACRDCDICELTEERIRVWLGQGTELAHSSRAPGRAQEPNVAASH